jgi:NTE family protein
MQIGLSLSGGGFRATVFHLGVLARLAEQNLLEQVSILSTVSGGSLAAGLIYAKNHFVWPTSPQYIQQVFPGARELITTDDLQSEMIWRALRSPLNIFKAKANYLSELLQRRWGITAQLCALPEHPYWLINATTYETGKNWRFQSFRMGDYVFGYSNDTSIPLSDAIAASAGFPGLIGALELDTHGDRWFQYIDRSPETDELLDAQSQPEKKTRAIQPAFSKVHLWDGGAYDNFGLEGLFDPDTGWRKGIEFLVVSDASGKSKCEPYQPGVHALLHIITGVMMSQIRALRARMILERMKNHDDAGVFLVTGNSCEYVLKGCGLEDQVSRLAPQCLSTLDATAVADTPTMIRRLTKQEFDLIFRHGFEVADYTLYVHYPERFQFVGYANSQCAQVISVSS